MLERDGLDGLVELARRCEPLRRHAELTDICWRDVGLVVESQLWLDPADGTPAVAAARDGRYLLDPRLTAGVPVSRIPRGGTSVTHCWTPRHRLRSTTPTATPGGTCRHPSKQGCERWRGDQTFIRSSSSGMLGSTRSASLTLVRDLVKFGCPSRRSATDAIHL